MNKRIAIIGAGGHGKVVGEIALLNNFDEIGFFDDNINRIKNFPFKIFGDINNLNQNIKNYNSFFVAIGNNKIRSKMIEKLKQQKVNVVSLIHPNSIVSRFSFIGRGSCIMANAVVNPGTKIKEGVIINTSASIDHDCLIDNFAHISPNCALSGDVKVGQFSHLGTGSSVHPGISIGNNVRVSVGSRIFKDI